MSNVVITLGTCFSMFVYIRAEQRKSDSSVDGEPQGNWKWNLNSRDVFASCPSFSRPAARAPRRACSQAIKIYCLLLACSQTLYFLFKVCRARVIKNKPRGIHWPPAQGGIYFSFSRFARVLASLSRTPVFSKRTKRKIKQHLCTGQSFVINYHCLGGFLLRSKAIIYPGLRAGQTGRPQISLTT